MRPCLFSCENTWAGWRLQWVSLKVGYCYRAGGVGKMSEPRLSRLKDFQDTCYLNLQITICEIQKSAKSRFRLCLLLHNLPRHLFLLRNNRHQINSGCKIIPLVGLFARRPCAAGDSDAHSTSVFIEYKFILGKKFPASTTIRR